MTGPVSNEERERTMTGLKMVTVLLVGLSAGLITSQGDDGRRGVALDRKSVV